MIWINRDIPTQIEKRCILAEESVITIPAAAISWIRRISTTANRRNGHAWAYEYLVPLSKIIEAYHDGIAGRHALAEYLEVTEEFLQSAIDRYREERIVR